MPHKYENNLSIPTQRWLWHSIGLGFIFCVIVVLCAPSFQSMLNVWTSSSAFNHCLAVLPLCAVLIFAKQGQLANEIPAIYPAALAVVMVFGAIWAAGRSLDAQILQHFSIIGLVLSSIVFIFGLNISKIIAFPLGLMVFAVPFGTSLIPILQSITATGVTALLNLTSIEVIRDATLLSTKTGDFRIAQSCSGLGFVLSALIISILFSHYAFNLWKDRLGFIGLAIVVAIIANIMRITAVIAMSEYSQGQSNIIADHKMLGNIFYGSALSLLIITGVYFSKMRTANSLKAR